MYLNTELQLQTCNWSLDVAIILGDKYIIPVTTKFFSSEIRKLPRHNWSKTYLVYVSYSVALQFLKIFPASHMGGFLS
jgi:hypothetical protein